jgi:hypothetical protein
MCIHISYWWQLQYLAQACTLTNCQGWNGVYLGSPASNTAPAFSFVDAVPYLTDSRCASGACSICDAIALAFTDYNGIPKGVVVDARGVNTTSGGANALNCTMGTSRYPNPWSVLSNTQYGNTVLLPTGTIYLYSSWILPYATRLIGEGSGLTTIAPCTSTICSGQAFSSTDMIDMGSTSVCPMSAGLYDCQAVVIQHLGLNGGNLTGVNGIVNSASEERSGADDVWLNNMGSGGIGLSITKSGTNSGPYSKIFYSGSGTCASIDGAPQTRGIHGLTCVMSGSSGAAILLDAPNNTLEDIYISGSSTSQDGILVGANAPASSNVLFNISGNDLGSVVHISSAQNTNSSCPVISGTPNNVCDVTVLGVTASSATNSIKDELTSPTTQLPDAHVGMYIVGELVQGSGSSVIYSRFTTSLSVPTWLVGSSSPSGNCAIGSLYSETSGTDTLWGCKGSSGVGVWHDFN